MKRSTGWALLIVALAALAARGAESQGVTPPPAVAPVAITTTLPTQGDNVPQLAFDGKPDTAFVSARPPKTGDTFTLTLAEPARAKDLKGAPEGTVLEISADGKEFSKGDLAAGPVKALRLRWTTDGAAPVKIGEITIDSTPALPVFKHPIQVVLDTAAVPDMDAWATRAKEIVERWYPTLCDFLASDGYTPPRRIDLVFKKSDKGIAGTGGSHIECSDGWFRAHPDDYGAIVHESIHVIQSYPKYDPAWLVEGIDDYVRFWIYEPDTKRRPLDPDRIKVTDSYQVTGAFLAWLYDQGHKDLVPKLNAALRKSQYKPQVWKDVTGKDLDTLWEEFRKSLKK
jgi:hypothetical protein